MQIDTIEIRNYRLFRNTVLADLPRMVVAVGANGSGKSTLFDVFTFLKEALTQNVAVAVARRGGFRELVSRGETGPIGITMKFRGNHAGLETYQLEIAEEGGQTVVSREMLQFGRGLREPLQPGYVFQFVRGRGSAIAHELTHDGWELSEVETKYVLDDPSALALKAVGQFSEFPAVAELRRLLENWHISDLNISEARHTSEAGYEEHLSTRGDNIALVAQHLYEHHRDRFDHVLEIMSQRIPGVTRVEAKPTEDGRLVLRFQDGNFKDPFLARDVSDGTLKMFAYLVLLYDPQPHPLLAVEEPENQLYPELLRELTEEFRDYARRGGQVFVSTHSPEFLNGAKLDEIYWLVKENGFTTARRASESELLRNLSDEGDLPGALWRQGFFEGAGLR
jgi:predicted ATPase